MPHPTHQGKEKQKVFYDIPYFWSRIRVALYDDDWALSMIGAVVAHTSQEHPASTEDKFSIIEMKLLVGAVVRSLSRVVIRQPNLRFQPKYQEV